MTGQLVSRRVSVRRETIQRIPWVLIAGMSSM